jgi:hypothetical protein
VDISTKVLAKELIDLDIALTGASFVTAVHTFTNSAIKHPLDFITNSEIYYLSDGGYSRLFVTCQDETDWDSIALRLDSVSTTRVKNAWIQCTKLRSKVEDTIKVALRLALDKEKE